MNMFDLQVPFFKPLWRRVAVAGIACGWALIELTRGEVFWAILFGASGIYCVYQFFVVFDPKEDDEDTK